MTSQAVLGRVQQNSAVGSSRTIIHRRSSSDGSGRLCTCNVVMAGSRGQKESRQPMEGKEEKCQPWNGANAAMPPGLTKKQVRRYCVGRYAKAGEPRPENGEGSSGCVTVLLLWWAASGSKTAQRPLKGRRALTEQSRTPPPGGQKTPVAAGQGGPSGCVTYSYLACAARIEIR